jgi:hypothetical protein
MMVCSGPPEETAADRAIVHAVALKSLLPATGQALTEHERALLGDCLDSISGLSRKAGSDEA